MLRNCFRIFEWFPSPELKRVTREDEPRRIIQKFNKGIAQQFCNKYVTSKWMLSKRLWLKNRSSTILVELPDFPGFYQSAVKLLQKSSVARSHSQANLGNVVRGKEKVSKRKQEICRYFVPTFVYILIKYFHNLPSLGKGYCIALHCIVIVLHCIAL